MRAQDEFNGHALPILVTVAHGRSNRSESYRTNVKGRGARCALMLHEGGKHGFFNTVPHSENTIREMITFLKSLGWVTENAESTA